jgi:hypothetical protein
MDISLISRRRHDQRFIVVVQEHRDLELRGLKCRQIPGPVAPFSISTAVKLDCSVSSLTCPLPRHNARVKMLAGKATGTVVARYLSR